MSRKKKINTFATAKDSKRKKRKKIKLEADATEANPLTREIYESTRSVVPFQHSGGATAALQTETETKLDARSLAEKNLELNEAGAGDGIYRGKAGYKNFITKTKAQISMNKFTGTQGPIRASKHFRATFRMDYQPDICKDYHDTGYCGFGDTCKFLHDRGNYKMGWQIEQEFQEKQKKRAMALMMGDDSDNEEPEKDDDLPFACFICKQAFVSPVVTRCGHYFCEQCAIDRCRETRACAACGKNTSGVFNPAKDIIEKMKAAKQTASAI